MAYLPADKAEAELAQSIKKATSPEETAPKQKHVRMHKIIKDGHPNVIKDALQETGWLKTCAQSVQGEGVRHYGTLIRNYVELLLHKLQYHRDHPEFNGTFDYEEYISLKNIDDPNEGFETISDLMVYQDRIDRFQKIVFHNFRMSSNNECRIASLVPLVEESYGIYKFITSMMRAMYKRLDASEALAPLAQKFKLQHHALRKFYFECSNLKYLTSLINVPKLPQEPPSLMDAETPTLPHRPAVIEPTATPPVEPSPEPASDLWAQQQRDYEEEQRRLAQQQAEEQERLRQQQMQQQREFEQQQRMLAEQERMRQEALMRQQMQSQQTGRMNDLEMQLLNYRNQLERDQMLLEQYDRRVKALEQELLQLNSNAQARDASKDELIRSLQSKRFLKANSAQEAIEKMERLQADMRAKNNELADLIRERDRARNELARFQKAQGDDIERLRRELQEAQERAEKLSRSKGDEVSALLARSNRERSELEATLAEKQALIDEFLKQIDDQQGQADHIRHEKDEEIAVLQAGMDECLAQLAELQMRDNQKDLQDELERLQSRQASQLDEIFDSILATCIQKVNDGIYELETPGQRGNENATPELMLSMIERASITSVEFMSALSKFMDGSQAGDHTMAITRTLEFADTIIDVLLHSKGIIRFLTDDQDEELVINLAKTCAEVTIQYFGSVMSSHLKILPSSQRAETVIKGDERVQEALMNLSDKTEDLILAGTADIDKLAEGEVRDLVEQEMSNAAKAIEEATAKIQALLAKPSNPEFSATDLQVHQLILNSVLALTNAIANLIKCATASQQEIVAQGRGTSSKAAFYKKHNRWTEGLISAAKAVAVATNLLVEAADGVISKTHSLEQLIVASNEVSAATAQLVAASRVKSTIMSRTQTKLEMAAKDVKAAAAELVKQVKGLVAQKASNEDVIDFNKLSVHEFKRREMEQQVKILKLDAELVNARRMLAEMRRSGYHTGKLLVDIVSFFPINLSYFRSFIFLPLQRRRIS
ncbi:I/LWEQ domain-containing protein [Radiomyces spectabilis]|uniref:I/LWEQ domain-containing protein n=1 Tax=Radiomyces spectabilis TaxID=64574 RepID=UPI0022204278|nr:I/LWEQ domain-containing protein [Radiomyces spectabilis]KAI8369538.1 I/LWEQ domain-containing protein [Radiomyces spectabilis]